MRPWMPLSVYDFACWARQTVVPLTVVLHYRPVRNLPPGARVPRAQPRAVPRASRRLGLRQRPGARAGTRASPSSPGRERALAIAERWIIDRQELDGSWGGIQPPWVWSLIALACRGHGPESPYLSRGLAGWKRFLVEDGDRLRPEACQSPVWDTGLALLALRAAGVPARRARARPRRRLDRRRGDPGARATGPSGARGSSRAAGPSSTTTTSIRTSTTRRSSRSRSRSSASAGRPSTRACRWMAGHAVVERRLGRVRRRQRRRSGSTRSRSATSARSPTRRRADVTAHVVELLAREGGYEEAVRRGVDYLLARAGGGRLVVRALGRQLRLRHRRGAARARGRRLPARPSGDPPRRRLARGAPERGRRLRRGLPLVRPRRGGRRLARTR